MTLTEYCTDKLINRVENFWFWLEVYMLSVIIVLSLKIGTN